MIPVARVPLWLLVSSRWGQGGPVRNAEKWGTGGADERRQLPWVRGSSCQWLHLHQGSGSSSEIQLSSQTPTLRFTYSQNCPSPPWLEWPFPPTKAERRRNDRAENNNKKPCSVGRSGVGWGSWIPPFFGILFLISFSLDEVAEEIKIEQSLWYRFNLQKFNIATYKPDQLKGDYSFYRQLLCFSTGFL